MNLSKNCKTFLDKSKKIKREFLYIMTCKHINNYTTQPNNWTKQLKIHICLYEFFLIFYYFAVIKF